MLRDEFRFQKFFICDWNKKPEFSRRRRDYFLISTVYNECAAFCGGASRKRRVLRGGSFINNETNARCAVRNDNFNDLNNNNGFRVAASHFPSRVGISVLCAVSFARNAVCSRMHGRGKTGEKARLRPGRDLLRNITGWFGQVRANIK